MKKYKIVSIIPARSGSKRIKDKNLKKINNKPLIYFSIKQSIDSKLINRTFVSTDSVKYQKIAKKYGAEAPFLRPKNISLNDSTDLECIKHLIKYLKKINYLPDYIVHLRPTYPFREKNLIDKCIKKLLKNRKFDSLRTITRFKINIEKLWYKKNKLIYNPITKYNQNHSVPKEKLKTTYAQSNCVDILNVTKTILKNSISGEKILGYEINHFYDIDDISDLIKVRKAFKKIIFLK